MIASDGRRGRSGERLGDRARSGRRAVAAAPGGPARLPGGAGGDPRSRPGARRRLGASGDRRSEDLGTDLPQVFQQPPPGQAPLLTDPYPLPGAGLVVRQTASGWRDEQHEAHPLPARTSSNRATYDLLAAARSGPRSAARPGRRRRLGGRRGHRHLRDLRRRGDRRRRGSIATGPPRRRRRTPRRRRSPADAGGGEPRDRGQCPVRGALRRPHRDRDRPRPLAEAGGRQRGGNRRRAGIPLHRARASPRGEGARLAEQHRPVCLRPRGGRLREPPRRDARARCRSSPRLPHPTSIARARSATFQAAFAGYRSPLGAAPPAGPAIAPLSPAGPGQGLLLVRLRRARGGRCG